MTFTERQQEQHRQAFIDECRQKAWAAACHAEWISTQLDKLIADYGKLKAEDEKLAEEIKALETAADSHTKDNRDKRKALQERRNVLASRMQMIGASVEQGQKAANSLYAGIESSLALAKHGETWEWKEVQAAKTN
jgi:uncharacterized protein YlxW (UPF0749 family)